MSRQITIKVVFPDLSEQSVTIQEGATVSTVLGGAGAGPVISQGNMSILRRPQDGVAEEVQASTAEVRKGDTIIIAKRPGKQAAPAKVISMWETPDGGVSIRLQGPTGKTRDVPLSMATAAAVKKSTKEVDDLTLRHSDVISIHGVPHMMVKIECANTNGWYLINLMTAGYYCWHQSQPVTLSSVSARTRTTVPSRLWDCEDLAGYFESEAEDC